MVITKIDGIKIAAMAAAVSNQWTPVEEVGDDDAKTIKKFKRTTGVLGRYDAGDKQTTSDFCCVAAREIIEKKKINLNEIGVLVFVTQTADYGIPSTACLLQDRLGLPKDCIAFDVNLGCSGFTYGVNIVASMMKTCGAKHGLLLAGDTSAKEKDWRVKVKTSRSASMLFGDSGTATLLSVEDNCSPITMLSRTDGSGFKAIIAPYGGWRNPRGPRDKSYWGTLMDEIAVFNFAVDEVPVMLKDHMGITDTTPEDYDCLVLHQANLFILKQVEKRSGFKPEQDLISIDEFGNTSSSSVPISLVKEYGGVEEDRVIRSLMCGFGIGLSWSTVDAEMNINDIFPLIHTDEYFEDGYEKIVEKELSIPAIMRR